MDRNRVHFVSAFVFFTTVLTICTVQILGVTNCPGPDVSGYQWGWKVGSTVLITASNFPTSLQPCVTQAVSNWNTANSTPVASGGNNSQVTLSISFGSPVSVTGKTNVMQITYSPNKPDGTPLSDPGVTVRASNGTNLQNANTSVNTNRTTCDEVTNITAHEIGHTMGLGDCSQCSDPLQSIMFPGLIPPVTFPPYQKSPAACDNSVIHTIYPPPPPPCQPDCPSGSRTCTPCGASPVILDTSGEGFHLTDARNGVMFDISGTGSPIQIAWIARGADNALLALPEADGFVHSGRDLFGNFTPQPPSATPNGFAALAVYDDPKHGGNSDGVIDARDEIYSSLRLWIDINHDGISQPEELHTLQSLGVISISLDYQESRRKDEFGNLFRYRARVNSEDPDVSPVARKAYDVFFVQISPTTKNIQPCPVPSKNASPREMLTTKTGW